MEHHRDCPHSHMNIITDSSDAQGKKIAFVVNMILEHFIAPHKVLYLLDPVQADKFKARNQGKGCCASHKITIPHTSQTQTQKWLVQLIHPTYLANHLNEILNMCSERHSNIIEKGKQDKLEINDEVDKFVMDKVLAQCANQYVYQQLALRVRESGLAVNKEIGLWATPASWKQKYPHSPLQTLPGTAISDLLGKGWALVPNYFRSSVGLLKELEMLEKDSKFEQKGWIQSQKSKILGNPEAYAELKGSQDRYLFENIRQASILLSSIPFELNLKANLFCTVSPNLHACYSKSPCSNKTHTKGQLKFTIILQVSSTCNISIGPQTQIISQGSLLLIDNDKHSHKVSCESGESLFMMRNFMGVVNHK